MAERAQRAEVSNDENQRKRRLRGCLGVFVGVALVAVVAYVGVLVANGSVSHWLDCRQDPGYETCSPGCEPRGGGGGC